MGVVAVLALGVVAFLQDIACRVEQQCLVTGAKQAVARWGVVVFLALWLAIGEGGRLRLAQAAANNVVVKLLFTTGPLVADQPLD